MHLTPSHDFGERQIIFVVKLGILVYAEICKAFAFFVSPSVTSQGSISVFGFFFTWSLER
jgi:hypothetical protein